MTRRDWIVLGAYVFIEAIIILVANTDWAQHHDLLGRYKP